MKARRIRPIGNDLSVQANDRIVLLKDSLHIEKIVVAHYEVVVDKYDHVCCVDQIRHASVTLACEAGIAKYLSHVGNGGIDFRNIRPDLRQR